MRKNKLKKLLGLTLALTLIVGAVTPVKRVNALESSQSYVNMQGYEIFIKDENVIEIIANDKGYASRMEGVFSGEEYSEFIITENGSTYTLIIDNAGNYIVNNKIYTEEVYFDALQRQVELIENNKTRVFRDEISLDSILATSEYKINTKEYKQTVIDHGDNQIVSRCVSCGHNPNYVPTSGYKSYTYMGNFKSNRVLIALTSGAISALATAYTVGRIPEANKLMQSIVSFASGIGTTIVGMMAQPVYRKEVAYHSTCPRAASERRKFWVEELGQNGPVGSWDVFTNNYYFIKPF